MLNYEESLGIYYIKSLKITGEIPLILYGKTPESEVKNRFSAYDNPILDPKKKSGHQIKTEGNTQCDKR